MNLALIGLQDFDLKGGNLYYFDSYGIKPPREVISFMKEIGTYLEKHNIKPNIEYNKIRHQYGGSECGVYSINVILRMLKGNTFKQICKEKTKDAVISQCRKVYYT